MTTEGNNEHLIAYMSMEIGIDTEIPSYAGGLGILAGDILRSFADLGIPAVGVTLLSEYGFFTQKLLDDNNQHEIYNRWEVHRYLDRLPQEVVVQADGKTIHVRLWRYTITGLGQKTVPIIFLDTNHEKNSNEHRKLTQRLYPTNRFFRLLQEIVLGIGGIRALKTLGFRTDIHHFNEGHSTLATVELLRELEQNKNDNLLDNLRKRCVFTTHTPVPSGHDRFPSELVTRVLNADDLRILSMVPDIFDSDGYLNMTRLGLSTSAHINGVAKKHAEVSRYMFPNYMFDAITNGVHHVFWTSASFHMLFDDYIPGWQRDPFKLLKVTAIPANKIDTAHQDNKKKLLKHIKREQNIVYDENTFTIGYARRITKYKRPDLIFYDLERLKRIAEKYPIQFVFAGKAHSSDIVGKSLIHEILQIQNKLNANIKLVFLENYNIHLAKIIIPGVDLWLNTPMRPLEASGTSGMKASLNGVPNFSVLDGWWLEGRVDGVTGWSIGAESTETTGSGEPLPRVDSEDSDDLYNKLENTILPMFYEKKDEFTVVRRNAIAMHGSYFNTNRVVQQYLSKSYNI
jgi:starch phosphorylase